ncbi:MAG: N-acetylmuramoyl-L-alanine amidase [Firmicutes bacterium]|nr:N-acetylmuramoyl-L-alanine amidase [Bacillota bacterium]
MFLIFKKRVFLIAITIIMVIVISVVCFSTLMTSSAFKLDIIVVIDAGHGGKDAGASGYKTGVKESDLNLDVCLKMQKFFVDAGIKIVMTRENQDGLYDGSVKWSKRRDLNKRKEIINNAKPDLVISVHMNTYNSQRSRRGAQVFCYKRGTESELAANKVQTVLNKTINANSVAVLTGDYFILRCNDYVSILVECGFLSNPEDERLLSTEEYRQNIAYQIFCGALDYLANMSNSSKVLS